MLRYAYQINNWKNTCSASLRGFPTRWHLNEVKNVLWWWRSGRFHGSCKNGPSSKRVTLNKLLRINSCLCVKTFFDLPSWIRTCSFQKWSFSSFLSFWPRQVDQFLAGIDFISTSTDETLTRRLEDRFYKSNKKSIPITSYRLFNRYKVLQNLANIDKHSRWSNSIVTRHLQVLEYKGLISNSTYTIMYA